MIKIYIASPYTKGNKLSNVNRSFDVASELIDLGFAPFAPLYTHYIDELHPKSYELWMKLDKEWLLHCDGLLRMEGKSEGADQEVWWAIDNNIPVFYSVDQVVKYYNYV